MFKKKALEYYALIRKERQRVDKDEAVSRVAEALGITASAVSQWGKIVPRESALLLERQTNGKLELVGRHYGM